MTILKAYGHSGDLLCHWPILFICTSPCISITVLLINVYSLFGMTLEYKWLRLLINDTYLSTLSCKLVNTKEDTQLLDGGR